MITTDQINTARALLCWLPSKLAKVTKLSVSTIDRAEKLGVVTVANLTLIQEAFEAAGVEFGVQQGVALKEDGITAGQIKTARKLGL